MKKALLTLICVIALMLALSVASFAASTTSNAYADTFDTVSGVTEPSVIDKNARAVVEVNGTYYTIPTYYIIKDQAEFRWGAQSAVATALGLPTDTSVRKYVVRIEIPEGIQTSVANGSGGEKLEDATKLVEATFPSSMTLIGSHFFNRCSNLTAVYGFENTKITKVYESTFGSTKITSISLPSTVTVIDSYAFSGTLITQIQLPSGLEIIGSSAFNGTQLTSISIPQSVITIKNHAFAGCSSLAQIVFEGTPSVTSIGNYAFEKSGLASFTIPNTVTSFGEGVFNACYSLTVDIDLSGFNLTSIPGNFMKGAPITGLILPESLTTIGTSAFHGHNISQSVLRIPNGVTSIGTQAFARGGTGGTNIATLMLPAKLTSLGGNHVFEKIRATTVYIPSGLTSIAYTGIFNQFWTSGVVFYYTGTKAQAENLISTANTSSNEAFTNAIIASLAEYQAATNKNQKNYLVYGINTCEAYYNGVHTEKLAENEVDTNPCVLTLCANCGLTGLYTGNEATHNFDSGVISYANGFASAGTLTVTCQNAGCVCNTNPNVTAVPAIYTCLGFAVKEDGTSLTLGYTFSKEAYEGYIANNAENVVSFGFVAYATYDDVSCTPLSVNEGVISPVNPAKTIFASMSVNFAAYDFVIRGFDESTQDFGIAMCAYTYDGESVKYLCKNTEGVYGAYDVAYATTISKEA